MLRFKLLSVLVVLACIVANSNMIMMALAYSNNCNGSILCGQVHPNDCRVAFNRYDNGVTYTGYTSRVSGSCTAIFRCNGNYQPMTGSQIKEQFNQIYASGCGRCGSHAFNGGSCEVTLNYCSRCTDSG